MERGKFIALEGIDRLVNGESRLRRTRALYFEAFERLKQVETVAVVDGDRPEDEAEERVWVEASPYFT